MKKIFLLSHATGKHAGLESLEEYLLRHGYHVDKFLHPLSDYSRHSTTLTTNGTVVSERARKNRGPLNYLEDFLLSVRQVYRSDMDVFIGATNFDTLPAIVCRKILRQNIPRIIYYPRDFAENKFNSRLLNRFYYAIEKAAVTASDVVISNTTRAEKKRQEYGLDMRKSSVIPNGVYIEQPTFRRKNISKQHFIYVGSVTREHGLHDLVCVLKPLISKLVIIAADGDDLERVKQVCADENIPLELHPRQKHGVVLDYLQHFEGFGLAPYNNSSQWTYYCSPLKVNEYVACGVPVITSALPEIAAFIREQNLGIVYEQAELHTEALQKALDNFDTTHFHKKAQQFYETHNNNMLYDRLPV